MPGGNLILMLLALSIFFGLILPKKTTTKQAGLSRATLEIYSRFSNVFPLWNMSHGFSWIFSHLWLDVFIILQWRLSSFRAIFNFGVFLHLKFKFFEDRISGCWDIPLLIIWGRPPLEDVFITIIIQLSLRKIQTVVAEIFRF